MYPHFYKLVVIYVLISHEVNSIVMNNDKENRIPGDQKYGRRHNIRPPRRYTKSV